MPITRRCDLHRSGESTAAISRPGKPQRSVVLGPYCVKGPIVADRQIEAAVVPDILIDSAFAVSACRPGKINRRFETHSAVARPSEKHIAAVCAAREDDLLPQDKHVARVARRQCQSGQPREHLGRTRDINRLFQTCSAAALVYLEENVLSTLVDPRNGNRAAAGERNCRIVDVVVPRFVLLPRTLPAVASRNLDLLAPRDTRLCRRSGTNIARGAEDHSSACSQNSD